MKSMTGFGRGAAEADGVRVHVEMGSVNRKTLDVQVSLPKGLAFLEPECQKRISAHCQRGRFQVRVQVESSLPTGATIDTARLQQTLERLNQFAADHGLDPVSSVEQLLGVPGVWTEDETVHTESLEPVLHQAFDQAVLELVAMREEEGRHLGMALEKLIDQLDGLVERAKELAAIAQEDTGKRFRAAVETVAEAGPEVEQRMLQEIALTLEKSDVQEEVDRLAGHVLHFREKMHAEGAIGRGLDFLCQELAREWHTLSVKTSHLELNQVAIHGKEQVERLREQVQNIE